MPQTAPTFTTLRRDAERTPVAHWTPADWTRYEVGYCLALARQLRELGDLGRAALMLRSAAGYRANLALHKRDRAPGAGVHVEGLTAGPGDVVETAGHYERFYVLEVRGTSLVCQPFRHSSGAIYYIHRPLARVVG